MKRKIKIGDFGRATSVKLAELKGVPVEDHEGYSRTNDGEWCVVYDDEEGGVFCTVNFHGTAKKKERWNAPDPEGFAIAQKIVQLWNESI